MLLLQFAYGYNSWQGEADPSRTVSHGAELAFVFSSPQSDRADAAAAVEDMPEPIRLADMMVGYFTNFAKTGGCAERTGPSSSR
eukprot:SAG22_NODE_2775_length_2223_cov_1.980226_4_plen_84_part_00